MTLLIIFAIIFILYLIVKPYIIKHDTVALYTGGLGSGKTLIAVTDCLRLLRRNRFKIWWYNIWHKTKKEKPMLYSSIPIRISKKEMSIDLKTEHVTLTERLNENN